MPPEPHAPSPFAAAAPALAARGYHVLPVAPGTKAPSEWRAGRWRPMPGWQRFRATPPTAFQIRTWASWPDANIGILTGTPAGDGHILACIDLDSDDPDIVDDLLRAIPPSPVAKRGRRGRSLFYRAPAGTPGFRTAAAELLTHTRQTVLPPSVHPDTGRPYRWTGDATLEATPPAALPRLSADAIARFRDTLEAISGRPVPAHVPAPIPEPDADASIWRRLNTAAYHDLDAWVPDLGLHKLRRTAHGYQAVAHWRPSTTGRPIASRNPNLSIMRGAGARDFGTGDSYTALDLVQAALGIDLDTAFGWLSARLGLSEDGPVIAPPRLEPAAPPPPPPHDPATGELLPDPPPAPPDPLPATGHLPDDLTRPPGLLGEIVDWIAGGARRPNRALALGAALPVLGTLIGQAIAGPTGSATHLYVVGLAPSGAGKDHPLQCVARLMQAARAGSLLGPSEFISMPAVVRFLLRRPLAVCAMDEIGAFFRRLAHPRASAYEKAISKVLRSVWSVSFDTMMTPEWASEPSREIQAPALSIFGVSTPEEFFAALEGDDVINGFLNRWLLVTAPGRIRDRDPLHPPGDVPETLAVALARLRAQATAITPADRATPIGTPRPPRRMVWNGGRSVYEDMLAVIERRIAQNPAAEPFHARTAEMAVRLATIRAAGCGLMAIDRDTMEWGRDIALWSAARMAKLAESHIAENDVQRLHNRILRIIRDAGGRIGHRELLRALQGRVRSRDLKDMMEQLTASGIVFAERVIPPAGGPPTVIYTLAASPV